MLPLAPSPSTSLPSAAVSAGVLTRVEYFESRPRAVMICFVKPSCNNVIWFPSHWISTPRYPSAVPSWRRAISSCFSRSINSLISLSLFPCIKTSSTYMMTMSDLLMNRHSLFLNLIWRRDCLCLFLFLNLIWQRYVLRCNLAILLFDFINCRGGLLVGTRLSWLRVKLKEGVR